MSITYYDPNRPQQRQYEMVMQMLMNMGMQKRMLAARKEEADIARTHAETMTAVQLQAQDLIRPTKGARTESVAPAGIKPTTTTGKVDVRRPAEKPDFTLGGKPFRATPRKFGEGVIRGNYIMQRGPKGQIVVQKIADTSKKQAIKGEDSWFTFEPTTGDFERTDIKIDKSGNKYQAKTKYEYDAKSDVVWAQDYNYNPKTGERTPVGKRYHAPKNLGFNLLKFMLGGQGGGLPVGTGSGWDGAGMYMMSDGTQKMVSTQEEYNSLFGGK